MVYVGGYKGGWGGAGDGVKWASMSPAIWIHNQSQWLLLRPPVYIAYSIRTYRGASAD